MHTKCGTGGGTIKKLKPPKPGIYLIGCLIPFADPWLRLGFGCVALVVRVWSTCICALCPCPCNVTSQMHETRMMLQAPWQGRRTLFPVGKCRKPGDDSGVNRYWAEPHSFTQSVGNCMSENVSARWQIRKKSELGGPALAYYPRAEYSSPPLGPAVKRGLCNGVATRGNPPPPPPL